MSELTVRTMFFGCGRHSYDVVLMWLDVMLKRIVRSYYMFRRTYSVLSHLFCRHGRLTYAVSTLNAKLC
jgi:hypothetical protein